MAELIPFIPKAEQTAAANMASFVRFCRESLTVFGAGLRFDDPAWDVSEFYPRPGCTGRETLYFTEYGPSGNRRGDPFKQPLGSQLRAYVRYKAGWKVTQTPPAIAIYAARAIAAALRQLGLKQDLLLVDHRVLDTAVNVAKSKNGKSYAPSVGQELAAIATFLRKNHLSVVSPVDWRHGIAGAVFHTHRIGPEAESRLAAKLPSQAALNALADAFHTASTSGDIILTSVVALLSCAPDRINEALRLELECEVADESGYKLRWPGSKHFQDGEKGIPEIMAPTAKLAIKRLRQNTREARLVATWYEDHPSELYLPTDCIHLRGKDLSTADVARIVGFPKRTGALTWLVEAGLKPVGRRPAISLGTPSNFYRFSDVENAIVAMLPGGWPILDPRTNLKFSRALMIVKRNELDEGWFTWRCMVAAISYQDVYSAFASTGAKRTIFERLGMSTPEKPIRLKSHQLRHYLNTIGQRGGLSQLEIAAWSGRRDVRQNVVYDHRRPEEVIERKRNQDREVAALRGGKTVVINAPVARNELVSCGEHGHATEIGFCSQDFAAAPCPMFGDCFHCMKHVCIKGSDPGQVEKLSIALTLARSSLEKAVGAVEMDYEGAEEWLKSHTETVQRLEQLQAIMTDPSIPNGTRIALAKSGRYDLVEQALHDHQAITGLKLTELGSAPVAAGIIGTAKHG